jgi:hypothetical protein
MLGTKIPDNVLDSTGIPYFATFITFCSVATEYGVCQLFMRSINRDCTILEGIEKRKEYGTGFTYNRINLFYQLSGSPSGHATAVASINNNVKLHGIEY